MRSVAHNDALSPWLTVCRLATLCAVSANATTKSQAAVARRDLTLPLLLLAAAAAVAAVVAGCCCCCCVVVVVARCNVTLVVATPIALVFLFALVGGFSFLCSSSLLLLRSCSSFPCCCCSTFIFLVVVIFSASPFCWFFPPIAPLQASCAYADLCLGSFGDGCVCRTVFGRSEVVIIYQIYIYIYNYYKLLILRCHVKIAGG